MDQDSRKAALFSGGRRRVPTAGRRSAPDNGAAVIGRRRIDEDSDRMVRS